MNCAFILVFFFAAVSATPLWDGLRVTWSPDPRNKWGFDSLPRDLKSAGPEFTMRDNLCEDSTANFRGLRYWYNNDPAVTLLFDVNGIIAGIQTSIPKSRYQPSNYMQDRNFVDDGDYWSVTAYFVDPSTICAAGRDSQSLLEEGTGNGVWLQAGPHPIYNSVQIPLDEAEIKNTDWKFGNCFPSMGNHYWFNVSNDLSCSKFLPNCLLYNGGKLTAFCFAINANLPSDRYEHPTPNEARMFMKPVPECFFNEPSFSILSTLHVYLADNARTGSRC